MPKINKKTRQPKAVSGQGYCRKCQKTKSLNSNFYEATNPFLDTNGYMSICKVCVNEIYQHYFSIFGNMREAIHAVCQDLDIRFSEQALEQTQSHIERLLANGRTANVVFGYYKSKLGSTGKANENLDTFRYKDSDNLLDINLERNINNSVNTELDEENFQLTDEIIRYWGNGRDIWEYSFLENEIIRLKTDFECSDYGMEMIMKDICFINLDIERIRQGLDKGDTSKLIKSRSDLMNDGNLKPVQATGADKNEKVSLGVFIRKWENEKPISKTLDDEMKRYIDTYMVGHLAKMEGLNNDTVRMYEEAIKDYTINFSEINNFEEEE